MVEDRLLWARLTAGRLDGAGAGAAVPWWSLTKTVIAAAVLRLAAAGRLELDAPRPEGRHTIRELLQHRARLPDYGALPDYHAAVAAGGKPWPAPELLARVGRAPDARWRYSNVGYLHLRRAIEAATGTGLDAALGALVLGPLGIAARLAERPEDLAATALPPPAGYHPGWVYHGCLVGTVGDAARALAGILGPGLLAPAHRAAMARPHPVGGALPGRPWRRTGYGLGLMVGTMGLGRDRALGHSAGGPGSAGAAYAFPHLPGAPVVAVFGPLADPGPAEWRAHALAREGDVTRL